MHTWKIVVDAKRDDIILFGKRALESYIMSKMASPPEQSYMRAFDT